MAYQLKTTGIAANCTMCMAVDPDTTTIKDFASAGVTTDLLVGANVTISSQAWDGNTRSYWVPGSGTADADFVKFGTTKPSVGVDASHTAFTGVWIGEVAGASARAFGASSSDYLCSNNSGSGGSTHPTMFIGSNTLNGAGAAVTSGQKRIFGFSLVRGTDWKSYAALHNDASMTTNTNTLSTVNSYYALTYLNRRNDNSTHQQDKTHAILAFSTALSEAEWDTLRDDWFGTLLEAASGDQTLTPGLFTNTNAFYAPTVTYDQTLTPGLYTNTNAFYSATVSLSGGAQTLTPGLFSNANTFHAATVARVPGFLTPVLKNNSGTVLASETGVACNVYNASTGALVVRKTGLTSSAAGIVSVTDAAMAAGTTYAYEIVLSAARRLPVAAA